MNQYDLIVVGSGPAGESAAELAAFFGHHTAIVERAKPGGTVTTTGGVPTKALREAALYYSGLKDESLSGLRTASSPEIAVDLIRSRTLKICEQLQEATRLSILGNGVDIIQGAASFIRGGRDGHDCVLKVSEAGGAERVLRAKIILIATGSRPAEVPDVPTTIRGVYNTDTVLQLGRVPREIVIAGGGAVGVEFATICHALGARVTVLDRRDRLIASMDDEISSQMEELFRNWGIQIHFNSTISGVRQAGAELEVLLSSGRTLCADTVLLAAGRVPNTDGMGLDEAGIDTDARGRVLVDDRFCTSREEVFAVGDVLKPTLASIAMEQGRAAVCHAFGIPFEGNVDPVPVSAVYGMPEASGAGLTERQCRERGLDFEVGRADLGNTPRGAIAGRGGFLKLLFSKSTRKLLGIHCIGDLASEITGIGQMTIRCGGTIDTLVGMSFNTPTYSYAYKYAALDGLKRLATGRGEAA